MSGMGAAQSQVNHCCRSTRRAIPSLCQFSLLVQTLDSKFDLSPLSSCRISLMRGGYSPFTHRTPVERIPWRLADGHSSSRVYLSIITLRGTPYITHTRLL